MSTTEPSNIPVPTFFEISNHFLEKVALRDGEALIRARKSKRSLISALDEHPDLLEAFRSTLRDPTLIGRPTHERNPPMTGEIVHTTAQGDTIVEPAFPREQPQLPLHVAGAPPPLQRTASQWIMQASVKNPPPERGLSRDELEEFWRCALTTREQCAERIATHTGPDPIDHHASRRRRKERTIRISMMEGVLDLLHRIVAPNAPYLCGEGCIHLDTGLDVPQLARFLDSIDLFLALNDYETEEFLSAQIARRWVRDLLADREIAPSG